MNPHIIAARRPARALSRAGLMTAAGLIATLAAACTHEVPGQIEEEDWAFDPANPDAVEVEDDVVGVALSFPSSWQVVRDPYLFRDHGFVLAEETPGDQHGVVPVARIAIEHEAAPGDVPALVAALRAEFPDVELEEWQVEVGGLPAVAVGPVPGGQPSVAIFAEADDAVLRIHYYQEAIDRRGAALLDGIRFVPRQRPVEALPLVRADSPEALFGGPRPVPNIPRGGAEDEGPLLDPTAAAAEYRLANGCWAQASAFFIQTTHSRDANGTGWSRMGTPNFWGDNTHGNWGLGRCASGYYTNDLYAIDYYVRRGDRLYSPFDGGTVMYAGWDPHGWWNYGKMVVIVDPTGKYWSLSAHLSYVNVVPGQRVNRDTLIGWGGSTGYAAPYPHVHQAFYRYASHSRGRPYGGRGLMQTRLRYLGNGGGAYTSFWKGRWASW